MRCLFSFQWELLEDAVRMIPADDAHGEWVLRKSGLLALLGYYDDALQLLTDGIIYVRRILLRINKEETVVFNRFTSLESSMLVLYDFIKQAYVLTIEADTYKRNNNNAFCNGDNNVNKNDTSKSDKVELINLEPDESDYRNAFIWNFEQGKFAGHLSDGFKLHSHYEESLTFDIGRITHTTRYGCDNDGVLAAIQYIAFREATGMPFRLNLMTNNEGFKGAIARVTWFNFWTSAALAIIAGDSKAVEVVFTRKSIAKMHVKEVDKLCLALIQLLHYAMRFRKTRNRTKVREYVLQDYALNVVPEAISRLVTKCSNSVFTSIIDLLAEIYNYPEPIAFLNFRNLLKRTMELMPFAILERILHKIWSFDIKPFNHYYIIII